MTKNILKPIIILCGITRDWDNCCLQSKHTLQYWPLTQINIVWDSNAIKIVQNIQRCFDNFSQIMKSNTTKEKIAEKIFC